MVSMPASCRSSVRKKQFTASTVTQYVISAITHVTFYSVPQWDHLDLSQPISHEHFMQTLNRYPIVVINFFAPWCHWCQRLEPAWEAATKEVHEKYPEGTDGRIRFAKVGAQHYFAQDSKLEKVVIFVIKNIF